MAKIMFADNDPTLIKLRKKWLTQAGYEVLVADSPIKAREIVARENVLDLAIMDVRLVNDDDDDDESGLYLARDTTEAGIPTIVLTGYPTYEFVRRAQTWFPYGTPAHINFVDKDETKDIFLKVVSGSLRGRNVFIVHGHAGSKRDTIEVFVRQLGLDPVILEEQYHGGRTIIQQLEHYSNVAYVIVLMTPDDICGSPDAPKARARQNVVFELGYFIGKYGLSRVKAIVMGDIELLSDMHGVLYIPFDNGGDWKIKLVREMRGAGLNVQL